jgi:4a-hydroxytetrahydrobiopterin dehydratase
VVEKHPPNRIETTKPTVTNDALQAALENLNDWQIIEVDGISQLRKVYTFNNFANALVFTNRVGVLAEEADHHPEILTEWGKVTVTWWTHTQKGLSKNDFAMAAKVDKL